MEKCNKIVIFDWGGVIENNNQSYYNISKAIIDIMRKYKCKFNRSRNTRSLHQWKEIV